MTGLGVDATGPARIRFAVRPPREPTAPPSGGGHWPAAGSTRPAPPGAPLPDAAAPPGARRAESATEPRPAVRPDPPAC